MLTVFNVATMSISISDSEIQGKVISLRRTRYKVLVADQKCLNMNNIKIILFKSLFNNSTTCLSEAGLYENKNS